MDYSCPRDHLRNLNIPESMGRETHPRVLRELVDVTTKPLSMIPERSWQSSEVLGDCRKGNIAAVSKEGNKEDPGNCWSTSLISVPGKIMGQIFPEDRSKHTEDRRWLETANAASPRANCA